MVIAVSSSLINPNISFILDRTLPNEQKDAKKIRKKSVWFWLSSKKKLYWRSFGGPYLPYVHLEDVDRLLTKLHEGLCRSHIGDQSLAHQEMT